MCQTPQGSGFPAGTLGPSLCPNISLPASSSILLPLVSPGTRGATSSIPSAQLPGCLLCQLGTLAKAHSLKLGLCPLFSITDGKEGAGVRRISRGEEWSRYLGGEFSRPHSGQTQEGCVCMSSGNNSGLTAECKTWTPFRIPATCSHLFNEH